MLPSPPCIAATPGSFAPSSVAWSPTITTLMISFSNAFSIFGGTPTIIGLRKATHSDGLSFCEADHAGADEEAAESDRAAAISRLIARLPEAQQEAVRLAFYRGMTQRQIAAYTGTPLGTVKTRLELALRKLRSAVLAFGELHEPMQAAA
jgi:RNA polymerase sigma factor (sigma-70 family)